MSPNPEEALLAEAGAPLERYQAQSSDVLEVAPVEGGELAAEMPGGCRHDRVVVTTHPAGHVRLRPDPHVIASVDGYCDGWRRA